eukprot:IDg17118t1
MGSFLSLQTSSSSETCVCAITWATASTLTVRVLTRYLKCDVNARRLIFNRAMEKRAHAGSKKYWAFYLVMENCRAENNELDGFTIDQTAHASILGGIATANDRHGYNIVTGTQLALFRGCSAVNNGKKSGVGYGFMAQNNENYGTGRLAFESCTERGSWRGAIKLRDVFKVFVSDSMFLGGGNSLCYELAQTRDIVLRNNRCAVPRNRKIKLIGVNRYREIQDRSVFKRRLRVVPIADKQPDPTCARGKRFLLTKVCCASTCKRCGGTGCGRSDNGPGPASCCAGLIRKAQRICANAGPPCLLS